MDIITLIVSIASIVISLFTFYWTSIRKKDNFYLVRIDNNDFKLIPEFALVNAGDFEVLVTGIRCLLTGEDGRSGVYPDQNIKIKQEGDFLLAKGKMIHCVAVFIDPLGTEIAELGRLEPNQKIGGEPLRIINFHVEVGWIRSDGQSFGSKATLYQYGVNSLGKVYTRSPVPSAKQNRFMLTRVDS